jgi:transcriptional regulator with XRE-family HTH domain
MMRHGVLCRVVVPEGMSPWNDPTALRRTIGLNIRVRRAELELSQEALAHEIGTSASHLSALEKGRRNTTVDQIQKIAVALGLEPVDLVRLRPLMGPVPSRRAKVPATATKMKEKGRATTGDDAGDPY